MSEIAPMHQKAINFATWVNSLVDEFALDSEDKTSIQSNITDYFGPVENYNRFMFCVVPSLCNVESTKKYIMNIRELKGDEKRKEAIANARQKLVIANAALTKALSLPEEDLDAMILKLSLYVNLFTDMYCKQ